MDPKKQTNDSLLSKGVFKVSVLQHHREQLIYLLVTHTFTHTSPAFCKCFCFLQSLGKFPKADLLLKVFLATMIIPDGCHDHSAVCRRRNK